MFDDIISGNSDKFWILMRFLENKGVLNANEVSWIEHTGGLMTCVDLPKMKANPTTIPDTLKFMSNIHYEKFMEELKKEAANAKPKTEGAVDSPPPKDGVN